MNKMVKRIVSTAAFVLAVGCLCLPGSQASAASKTAVKNLAKGKTYNLDLNGGKKEKISWTESKSGKLTIKVNGKVALTCKHDPYEWAEIKYMDWNTGDKYKELVIMTNGDSDCLNDMRILRYYKPGKTQVYKYKKSAWRGDFYRLLTRKFTNSGKNKITLTVDTPFYCPTYGNYYMKVSASIKKNYFYIKRQSSYKAAASKLYMKQADKNGHYTLARSMKLYDGSDQAHVLSTLKSGTQFDPISYIPVETDQENNSDCEMLVKVKTTDGETGWLFFPAEYDTKPYLKFVPGWG